MIVHLKIILSVAVKVIGDCGNKQMLVKMGELCARVVFDDSKVLHGKFYKQLMLSIATMLQ